MLSGKAEGTAVAEIRAMAVAIAGCDRRKCLQTINGLPLPFYFDGVAAQQAAQSGSIGLMIIGLVFIKIPQKLLG